MIVLKLNQLQSKFLGLVFTDDKTSIWFKLYGCFSFFVLAMMFEPQLVYLLANYNEVEKATDVFIQIAVETFTMYKMVMLLINRNVITMLLQTMQADCDQMQFDVMHTNHLVRANHKAAQLTWINNVLIVAAGIAHTGGPLIIMLSHHLRGTFHRDLIVLPLTANFPFESESWFGYTVAYLLTILYNLYIGNAYSLITTMFVGMCLLAMGYLENMSAHFTELDEKYERLRTNRKLVSRQQHERYLRDEIGKGISEHCKILKLLDLLAISFSGIIFAQFAGDIILLSTTVFQVALNTGETMLMYFVEGLAVIVNLFLFSYFGSLLTDKFLDVHDSIYQLKWYTYPIKEQRHILLLLVRLQKPFVLCGYGFVNCTLQNFVQVLQTVGSVLAVFQSMEAS